MPKATTFRKWRYRARLFNHRQVPVPDTVPPQTASEYFYHRDIAFDVAQGVFGRITVVLPDNSTDVMQGARLAEMQDSDGNEIYPGGVWSLGEIIPIFYFGKREGFQAQAQLIAGAE